MANPRGQQRDKPFRDSLRIEIADAGENHKQLRKIARALLDKAEIGDMNAIKEVADRMDGKVPQAIVGDDEHDAIRVDYSPKETAKALATFMAKIKHEKK